MDDAQVESFPLQIAVLCKRRSESSEECLKLEYQFAIQFRLPPFKLVHSFSCLFCSYIIFTPQIAQFYCWVKFLATLGNANVQ